MTNPLLNMYHVLVTLIELRIGMFKFFVLFWKYIYEKNLIVSELTELFVFIFVVASSIIWDVLLYSRLALISHAVEYALELIPAATTSGVCGSEYWPQGFVQATKALYQVSYIPSSIWNSNAPASSSSDLGVAVCHHAQVM